MARRGSRDGFRRIGSVPPEGFGLSASRLKRLEVEKAWREAVGPGLADRVRCDGVRNGVLHLRAADAAWARAVRALLPAIASRMRSTSVGEKVGRFRIVVDGGPEAVSEPFPAEGRPR